MHVRKAERLMREMTEEAKEACMHHAYKVSGCEDDGAPVVNLEDSADWEATVMGWVESCDTELSFGCSMYTAYFGLYIMHMNYINAYTVGRWSHKDKDMKFFLEEQIVYWSGYMAAGPLP